MTHRSTIIDRLRAHVGQSFEGGSCCLNRTVLCVVAIAVLSGCANWTSVYHRPDFDTKGVIMDAKQRAIVVKQWKSSSGKSFACAEPSPDALASFAASLAAEVKHPEVMEGAIRAAFGDSASSLGGRTATIQLFRDALFRACEALMNNAIEETEYLLLAQKYQDAMVTLLSIEQLATMHRTLTGATTSSTARVTDSRTGSGTSSGVPQAGAPSAGSEESEGPESDPQTDEKGSGALLASARTTATPFETSPGELSDVSIQHVSDAAKHMVDRYYSRNPVELVCVQIVIRATSRKEDSRGPSDRELATLALEAKCFEYLAAQIQELTREVKAGAN